MKHWRVEQVGWDRFDPSKVDPEIIPLVKAAAMVERNGGDYAIYLKRVFAGDPDFSLAADHWAEEEIQHGDALGAAGDPVVHGQREEPAKAMERTPFRQPVSQHGAAGLHRELVSTAAFELEEDGIVYSPLHRDLSDAVDLVGVVEA